MHVFLHTSPKHQLPKHPPPMSYTYKTRSRLGVTAKSPNGNHLQAQFYFNSQVEIESWYLRKRIHMAMQHLGLKHAQVQQKHVSF